MTPINRILDGDQTVRGSFYGVCTRPRRGVDGQQDVSWMLMRDLFAVTNPVEKMRISVLYFKCLAKCLNRNIVNKYVLQRYIRTL